MGERRAACLECLRKGRAFCDHPYSLLSDDLVPKLAAKDKQVADEHTPEPWGIDLDRKVPGQKHGLCIPPGDVAYILLTFEDYKRAAACVNACKGVSTKKLEAVPVKTLAQAYQYVYQGSS